MSEQFSILGLKFQGVPEVECRMIISSVTGAHIAGLPLRADEEQFPLDLQRLPSRIHKHFGDVPYVVIEPQLKSRKATSWLAFPKVEHMAFLLDPESMLELVVIWYEDDSQPLISADNRRNIERIEWHSVAKKMIHETART